MSQVITYKFIQDYHILPHTGRPVLKHVSHLGNKWQYNQLWQWQQQQLQRDKMYSLACYRPYLNTYP